MLRQRKILWLGCSAAVVFAVAAAWLESERSVREIDPAVREHVLKVISAERWAHLSGGYWENEMVACYRLLQTPAERRIYLMAVAMRLEMRTTKSMTFLRLAEEEMEALRNDMVRFRSQPGYARLSRKQQERIEGWIVTLRNATL